MRIFVQKSLMLISVVILLSASFLLFAQDPVLDLIERGKKAYQKEDYKLANELLQEALSKINEKISAYFKPFLPEAPSGWTAEEPESKTMAYTTSSGNVRVTEAERRYIRKTDERSVIVMITNTPELLEPYHQLSKALQGPMMKGMVEGMMKEQGILETEKKDGWHLFLEQESSENYKISAVHEEVLVVIEDAESGEMAEKFLEMIDLAGLVKVSKK